MALVVTVAKGVKVDYTEFAKHLALYQMVMRKSITDVVKQQARLFAKDMCDFTPPFSGSQPAISKGGEGGFGNKARNKGRDAVSRDVRKIFAPLAQAPATGVASAGNLGIFSAWIGAKAKLPPPHDPQYVFKMVEGGRIIGQGEFERFKQIEAKQGTRRTRFLMGATEGSIKSIHEQRRGKPSYKVYETGKTEKVYVDDWKPVERYIKRVQQRVGKLKSGWYYAGLKLGKMPTSAWIANQGAGTSIYQPKLIGPDPTIKLGSTVGRNYSQGYHFMRMAMNHRAFAMRVAMLKHLQAPRNHGKLADVIRRLQGGFTLSNTDS
ncbi:hypothetical protein UFOVP583_53 [uncultured Caudovirales phage]|uniref:Uncharacterized protein n=1 Tax=uncultured Caudovirales phage TaxID=2100421 RepID=A0A6J5N0H6_9CAUD|nr:hypothetical protein UFOVP583_53 [uncultured Caudovirales phage]